MSRTDSTASQLNGVLPPPIRIKPGGCTRLGAVWGENKPPPPYRVGWHDRLRLKTPDLTNTYDTSYMDRPWYFHWFALPRQCDLWICRLYQMMCILTNTPNFSTPIDTHMKFLLTIRMYDSSGMVKPKLLSEIYMLAHHQDSLADSAPGAEEIVWINEQGHLIISV